MATTLSSIEVAATLLARLGDTREEHSVLTELPAGLEVIATPVLTHGTTADKANGLIFARSEQIPSGQSRDVNVRTGSNLGDGSLSNLDLLKNAIALVEIVALLVHNQPGSAGALHVGGQGTGAAWSAPFNDDNDAVVVLTPGGILLLFAPVDPAYAVGAVDDDTLKLAAVGGNVTYDCAILGRTA